MTDTLIPQSKVYEVTRQALVAHGAAPWIADHMATAVTWAEARGNRICGLYYLESYCQQLRSGRVDGTIAPDVEAVRPGFIRAEARYGFAQPAFARGLPQAIAAAQVNGTATLAVAQAHTCTALGFFTEQIAKAGMIGLGMTNASPIVAAPGGSKRVIGTNPFACAVPDGRGGVAMAFDFSTSAVALGKITQAKAAGRPIPLGWAVDKEGTPTTDPEAALAGALVSAGGHKGWGIGLMVELLAAGLTGGRNSIDVAPLKAPEGAPHDLGQTYLLIDPSAAPDFGARLARLQAALADDPGARLPGAATQPADPVPIDPQMWDLAQKLAQA